MSDSLQNLIDISFGTDCPYEGDFRVDDNVWGKFTNGTKMIMARRYATSAWTVTAHLHLALPDGSEDDFFLKSAPSALGGQMLQHEFHAIAEFYKFAPDFVPKPHS